uniref:Solute carrier family 15 member 2 n=1 Tax=Salarias fasciatus TaxID=181472 RepID=A0A672INR0_SALFA
LGHCSFYFSCRGSWSKLCGTNYPVSIGFIVVNEFCERFSYYGMKALLTLYFVSYLHWDKDLSTAIYHAFSSLCYFTPILGALIADSWLGKFKTIIYLSIVYVIGHVVKSVGAIPTVGNTEVHIALSMVGLILIALGTGGIKPCVAAFGGDQFEEEHVSERQKFFSIFYMSINAGSLLSTIITPILRGDVQCFGGDCYALAFGVPAILMVVALVVFIAGSGLYKKNPPQGNILVEVCSCIGFAIRNRLRRWKYEAPRAHWLDWAEDKYPKRLIQEIKMVLRVLILYIPLPMFWALFDQQGSRWTLQSTRMNMALVRLFWLMLNPLLILIFVPIFDLVIYPLVGLCRIKITPLRKMRVGLTCAAVLFGPPVWVWVWVTVVDPAPAGKCLLQVYNLAEEPVTVKIPNSDLFQQPIQHLQVPTHTWPEGGTEGRVSCSLRNGAWREDGEKTASGVRVFWTSETRFPAEPPGFTLEETDNIHKSDDGNPFVRFVNTQPEALEVTLGDTLFAVDPGYGVSANRTVDRGRYSSVSCCSASGGCSNFTLGLLDFGASYTFVLTQAQGLLDVEPNNVHIAWQIPQYVLITMGEVMFSVTGLEFSYSQAPANMKSVLQAGWLLTVAFGNVIVLIVAEGAGLEQWKEFVLFAGLVLAVAIIFSIMAHFYTYVTPEQLEELQQDDDSGKKKGGGVRKTKGGKST